MLDPARRRRIALMLESDGPGGAETIVLRLAEELASRGHHVVPVGPARGSGWLAGRFREAGFQPATFTLRRAIDFGCVRELVQLFRDQQIDVVHSHEFTMAVYGAAACRIAGVRHVITMHGSQTVHEAWRRRVALRWAFRNSASTVTISHDTRRQMSRDLGVRESQIGVVINGVPTTQGSAAEVRRELGITPEELVILAVGNLDPRKAHIDLLRAMQQLTDHGLEAKWRIVIAGGRGGDEHEKLVRFAKDHTFDDRLHVLLNRSDVANLLAASHIFVMPSLWEGLPMALLEAMLSGKAVIASNVSGIPEAVRDEQTGLLFPPGDVGELASRLRRVIESSELRNRLGAAAREDGLQRFTLATMADSYEKLYQPGGNA